MHFLISRSFVNRTASTEIHVYARDPGRTMLKPERTHVVYTASEILRKLQSELSELKKTRSRATFSYPIETEFMPRERTAIARLFTRHNNLVSETKK